MRRGRPVAAPVLIGLRCRPLVGGGDGLFLFAGAGILGVAGGLLEAAAVVAGAVAAVAGATAVRAIATGASLIRLVAGADVVAGGGGKLTGDTAVVETGLLRAARRWSR